MELARHIVRDRQRARQIRGHTLAAAALPRRRVRQAVLCAARRLRPRRRSTPRLIGAPATATIEVRAALAADFAALERIAALDEKRPLSGHDLLVAEVDGTLWAALDVDSLASIANPFVPSADAVELLRVRAAQLGAMTSDSRRSRERSEHDRTSATVGV